MRDERNRILHMVHSNVLISPEKLIVSLVKCHDHFIGQKSWFSSRLTFLERSPENSIKYSRDLGQHKGYSRFKIHVELGEIVNILKPKEVREYFDHDKRSKPFMCPECVDAMREIDFFDLDHHAEYLHSYQKNENSYGCFICGYEGVTCKDYCINRSCGERTVDETHQFCIKYGAQDGVGNAEDRDEF